MIVDPDAPATWPEEVRQLVERWDDSGIDHESVRLIEEEYLIRDALAEHRLRSYHCTRLTVDEIESIRSVGLEMFSRELFDRRIREALAAGQLQDDQAEAYLYGHLGITEPGRARTRWGKVYLSVGESVLKSTGGVEPLLGSWGGEGIYFSEVGLADTARLSRVGTPTVVVCSPTLGATECNFFPNLARIFLDNFRRHGVAGDFVFHAPVPADEVEAFWQPGHPEYDKYPDLPR